MSQHDLLIFAIGPVQSFIATARRTQDLYLGSRLLSHLARSGVEAAASVTETTLLYPIQRDGVWLPSIPNRFVVQTPGGQGPDLAGTIDGAIRAAWSQPEQRNGVADQVENLFACLAGANGVWRTIWRRQVDGWLESYWVVCLWDGERYGGVYNRAGLALDMRKRLRAYPLAAEPGEKCTLCGVRQALCDSNDRDLRAARRFWRAIASSPMITSAEVRDGERLCAICTIKRFTIKAGALRQDDLGVAEDDAFARFPSTSSIAATGFRQGVLDHWSTLGAAVREHLRALDRLNQPGDRYQIRKRQLERFPALHKLPGADELLRYDGDFFYRETFTPQRLKEILGREPQEGARLAALKTLAALLAQVERLNLPLPHSYLAILALDGDRIGELLGTCDDTTQHSAISAALTDFAKNDAPQIVEQEHPGSLVYAGGDDVLALLPVGDALAVAHQLRMALSKALEGAGHPGRTVSCGIALLHHMQPLEGGIRAARGAEERAKEGYGRNALVVDVLRRSGERRSVGIHWDYFDAADEADRPTRTPIAIVDAVRQAILAGMLSGKVGYEVDLVAPTLAGDPRVDAQHIPAAARQAELRRLFKRHTILPAAENAMQLLAGEVAGLTESLARQQGPDVPPDHGALRQVAGWLLLARLLAQGGER